MKPGMTLLDYVKAVESVESLLLVTDDVNARRLMVAWTLYAPAFNDKPWENETLPQAYHWLWQMPEEIDFDRLSDIAGLPWSYVKSTFERLKIAKLIFPDGTINQTARSFIRAEVNTFIRDVLPRGVYNAAKRTDAGRPGVSQPNSQGVRTGLAAESRANPGGRAKADGRSRPNRRPGKKAGS